MEKRSDMDKTMALDLYKIYRGELYDSTRLHRETLQNYLAFAITVIGVTVAAITQIANIGLIGIFISAIPLMNSFVCLLAIKMCDRFY